MVVLYGERVMCNVTNEEGQETPITVTEYIVNDLKEDELAFHNPLHRQILTEAAERIHNEVLPPNGILWRIPTPSSAS